MAAHGFTVVAGFLIDGPEGSARAPIGTNFVTVDAPRLNDGASGVLYITLFGVGAAHVVYHPEWYAWTRGINDDTSTGSGMKEEL